MTTLRHLLALFKEFLLFLWIATLNKNVRIILAFIRKNTLYANIIVGLEVGLSFKLLSDRTSLHPQQEPLNVFYCSHKTREEFGLQSIGDIKNDARTRN